VAEDCTLCHSPHGSVHTALLKKNTPCSASSALAQRSSGSCADWHLCRVQQPALSGFLLAGAVRIAIRRYMFESPCGTRLMR